MRAVLRQPDDRREPWGLDRISQAADPLRRDTDADARSEDLRRQLAHTLHRRAAAGEDDTAAQPRPEARLLDLVLDQVEDLVDPLMDDVREQLPRNLPIALGDGARQLDHVRRVDERLVCAA